MDNVNAILSNIFDYCIVGSGIGGASLAMKLQEQGKTILIIEAGKIHKGSSNVVHVNVGHEFGLRATRSIQLGGTSNLWHGVLSLLDPIDFQKRDYIPNSGWPITYEELLPFYKEASQLYNVKEYDFFFQETLSDTLKVELKKPVFNRNVFQNKLFQQPLPPARFKKNLITYANHNKQFSILTKLTALEIITNTSGNKVDSIKVADSHGRFFFAKANIFIIAAGALESPRLFLNSKSKKNEFKNDNIGKYLMDHPMGNLMQIQFKNQIKAPLYSDTKYAPKSKIKTGLLLIDSIQTQTLTPNHCFYLRPSFIKGINDKSEKVKLAMLTFLSGKITLTDIYHLFTNFNVVMQILAYKFTLNIKFKYADIFLVTEQIPNPNSRISLSEKKDKFGYPIAKVDWQITQSEISKVKECYDYIRKAFPATEYIFTHNFNDINWKAIFTSAAHHVGTLRMATEPKHGVVDENLKVFGIENLYVCDGSVFPTSGNVNSGFTITALACRLANHLK